MDNRIHGWCFLALSLLIVTLGLKNLLLSSVLLSLLVLGFGIAAYSIFRISVGAYKLSLVRSLFGRGIVHKLKQCPSSPLDLQKPLSGYTQIDDQIRDIITFILRDYVTVWYSEITDQPDFIDSANSALQEIFTTISARCKSVDWTTFLTTRFVDECACHVRLYRQAKAKKDPDVVSTFFSFEEEVENRELSRKRVSADENSRQGYLGELSAVLCYLLLPQAELNARPVQFIVKEILSEAVLESVVELLADPDFVNQSLIWLSRDFPVSNEIFLNVIRTTDCVDELFATQGRLTSEIALLRSRDLGDEDDILDTKQQLSSLLFVQKLVKTRLSRLQEGSDVDSTGTFTQEWYRIMLGRGARLYQLDLEEILRNSVAFSYFLDHVTVFGGQAYLFFCMNVNSWKIATEEQLRAYDQDPTNPRYEQLLSNMREVAQGIYDNYLSERAAPRLRVDDATARKLQSRIKLEVLSPTWFVEVEVSVKDKLVKEDRFLPSFRRDTNYIKLLAELDLLHFKDSNQENEDAASWDNLSLGDSSSAYPFDVESFESDRQSLNDEPPNGARWEVSVAGPEEPTPPMLIRPGDCIIRAEIVQKALVKGGLSSHASYVIVVTKLFQDKEIEKWEVFRRYSDFFDFHCRIKEQFTDLGGLQFPAKKAFNNLDRLFLERRLYLLNKYLQQLLRKDILESHLGLKAQIMQFLDHGAYEHEKSQVNRKVDTFVNPLMKSVTSMVRTVPDTLLGGIGKMLMLGQNPGVKDQPELLDTLKVGSFLDPNDDNIPLRILLLLLDEVFEMRTRPAWLRRHIINILRDILHSLMGDVVNQKILGWVDLLTSPPSIADTIKAFKNSKWPNGWLAHPQPPRDEATKMRTRVAAKACLLASLSDELTRIIGNETSRRGIIGVFEMLQHTELNRRLVLVLLESALEVIFPDHPMRNTFVKLHAQKHPER